MYTMWLKNNKGEVWDLTPKPNSESLYESIFFDFNKFSGMSQEIKTNQVKKDLNILSYTNKFSDISGTMLFESESHKNTFLEFLGNKENTFKLYYDPSGKIYPQTQIVEAWFKTVSIIDITDGIIDLKIGCYTTNVTFKVLSSVWKKNQVVASTLQGISSDPHVIPYHYPFFYVDVLHQKYYLDILNDGDVIGCEIQIKNNTDGFLPFCIWSLKNENSIQYASWLAGTYKLNSKEILIVNSDPINFNAIIQLENGTKINVENYQEVNPQYINFVELQSGINNFIFEVGGLNVDITVSYTKEQILV